MRPLRVSAAGAALAIAAGQVLGAVNLPAFQRAAGYCISAEKAMKAGNLRRAKESLASALRIMPGLPAVHMGLGHIALTEKRYGDALHEYQRARDSYAEVARALLSLQVKDYTDSRYEIVALEDEIRNQTKLSPVVYRLNRLEAAIERLERMEPPNRNKREEPPADVDFYIGNALFHLGRLQEATASWRSCLQSDGWYAPAYQNLAAGYSMMGRFEDAQATVVAAERQGFTVDPRLKTEIEKNSAHRVN